jgi:Family of unknown function (DUF5999)
VVIVVFSDPSSAVDGQPAANRSCSHQPACPDAQATDGEAALPVATHPEQGWSLLCNGIVLFEDTGELLPDGRIVAPHRLTDAFAQA